MIINMVGGGGGFAPSNAIVGVTAYAGSTVTISNGTVTKTVTADKSHVLSDLSNFAIYYFGIPSGMFSPSVSWNIVAEYQGEETTATIIVDTNAFYDIVLTYRIPYEYQEVEYLESNGSQYIDTLINVDSIKTLKARTMLIANGDRPNHSYSLGGSSGSKQEPYYSREGFGIGISETNDSYLSINSAMVCIFDQYNRSSFGFIGNLSINLPIGGAGSCSFARESVVSPTVYTLNEAPITFNGSLYLFTMHFNDGVNLITTNKNRFYSCEITNRQNQIVSNLVPCYRKSDSVAGMYDNVNHRFLTNQGTGTFVVGSDVNS